MTIEQSNLRNELRKKKMHDYEEEIVSQGYGANAKPNLAGNAVKSGSLLQVYKIFSV